MFARFSNLTKSLYARASTPENVERAKLAVTVVTMPFQIVFYASGTIGTGLFLYIGNEVRKNRPAPAIDLDYTDDSTDIYVRSARSRPFTINSLDARDTALGDGVRLETERLPLKVEPGQRVRLGAVKFDPSIPANKPVVDFKMGYTFPFTEGGEFGRDLKFTTGIA